MNQHPTYLPHLDGWRGLAICFLLLGHFFPVAGINFGSVGVNFFFVLSGFLMSRLLFVKSVPIPIFYKRRIARIFPTVFCFLATIMVVYLSLGWPVKWNELAAAAAFVNNYFPQGSGQVAMPFAHIWSLCVEEHSYILLSIVALAARAGLVRAKVAVGLLAGLFASVGVIYWLTYQGSLIEFERWLRSEVSAYGIFMTAFLLLVFEKRTIGRLHFAVVPGLVVVGVALHWWSVPAPVRTVLGVGAFALAINLLEAAGPRLHAALSFRPLRQLGVWSFSIYLWQQPFYLYVHRQGLSPWIGLGLAILTGIASFYLLENPARNYLNRTWGARGAHGTSMPTPA